MNKKRILMVDDEVASARIPKASLEPTGRHKAPVEGLPEDAAGETAHGTMG